MTKRGLCEQAQWLYFVDFISLKEASWQAEESIVLPPHIQRTLFFFFPVAVYYSKETMSAFFLSDSNSASQPVISGGRTLSWSATLAYSVLWEKSNTIVTPWPKIKKSTEPEFNIYMIRDSFLQTSELGRIYPSPRNKKRLIFLLVHRYVEPCSNFLLGKVKLIFW